MLNYVTSGITESFTIKHLTAAMTRAETKLHDDDLRNGRGSVYLPNALERKYPNAAHEWQWQYAFPPANFFIDLRSGEIRGHHISDDAFDVLL
ncbi:MAG: hypothetical protein M3209_04770 [Acidobacteriota bacterium]|nr:hypothetical protein [Acidobacteriota bacterium]